MKFIVAFLLLFFTPTKVIACDGKMFGGGMNEQISFAAEIFEKAKYLAWQNGHLTLQQRNSLSIEFPTINDKRFFNAPIFQRGKKTNASVNFIRHIAHLAVLHSHQKLAPTVYKEDSVTEILRFRKKLFQNTKSGRSTEYFPFFIGLTVEECKNAWTSGKNSPSAELFSSKSSMYLFWFLHEIGHFRLNHKAVFKRDESWQQEYAADAWAIDNIILFFGLNDLGPDHTLETLDGVLDSFDVFSLNHLFDGLVGTNSHPSNACRKARLIKLVKHKLKSARGNFNHSYRENSYAILEIKTRYIKGSLNRNSIIC